MTGLYDRDVLAWAEQWAGLLRRLATGERVNAEIDWPNVIEEVHDVGISELRTCESLWQQAMLHVLKLHHEPDSDASGHWSDETFTFLADASRRFAPSMRQRVDFPML